MIRVALLDPTLHAAFDAYVADHPHASVFHTRAWLDNACAALAAEPRTFVACDGDAVVGALPAARLASPLGGARLVSIPFCRYLPVLASDADTVSALVETARRDARALGCRYLELRSGPLASAPAGAVSRHHFDNWSIDLAGGEAACWARLHPRSTRRAIRFAERHGVEVRRVSTPEGYRILTGLDAMTRRRQGVPRHPAAFLRGLGERFEPSDQALLLIAVRDGEAVAAELALRHRSTWHGILGVDGRAGTTTWRASTLLLWEAIRHAIRTGAERFDLGPAHRGNAGLTAFKRRFGALATPADTLTFALAGRARDAARIDAPWIRAARWALRTLPPPLHGAVSPLLVAEVA
ncbi:MAG: GNAT family N-acetyltransferase [bacterium]